MTSRTPIKDSVEGFADPNVMIWAKMLWDYHSMNHVTPESVDLLLVAGSHDDRVAFRAAELAQDISILNIVTSGGYGKITQIDRSEPEAERFAKLMISQGVADDRILREPESSNMGENFTKTRDLLNSLGRKPRTGLVVTKPYMERRAYATGLQQWPEVSWKVTSPEMSFQRYMEMDASVHRTIELMVGDLQRIEVYAQRGIQAPQDIPASVRTAFERLVEAGFTGQLIK